MANRESGGHPKIESGGELNINQAKSKMEGLNSLEKKRILEHAPEGWITKTTLANILEHDAQTIEKIASEYRAKNPEWFRVYLGQANRPNEHYHPDLIAAIKERLTARGEIAPDGWLTCGTLKSELNVSYDFIKGMALEFRDTHPEWFKIYIDRNNRNLNEHYNPKLIALIKDKVEKRRKEQAPEGWMTKTQAEIFGAGVSKIEKIASEYRESHPEWFRTYSDEEGRLWEYYHPDLLTQIEQILKKQKYPPKGWLLNGKLASSLDLHDVTVRQAAEKFRHSHPEWFVLYLDSQKRLNEHYHPDLVKVISEKYSGGREKAPKGWRTNNEFAQSTGFSNETIKKIADEFRSSNPEWFHRYLDPRNSSREYYHPDLVEKINNSLELANVPKGWLSIGVIAKSLDKDFITIQRIAEKYRLQKPDWFKIFRDHTKRENEHYHPDLIKIIRDHFNFERAPKGWMSKTALAKELGITRNRVKEQASQFRPTHPEWFKTYSDEHDRHLEFFHPDLVALLIPKFTPLKEQKKTTTLAPTGWLHVSAASDIIGIGKYLFRSVAEKYRETQPEWFKQYLDKKNKLREHFHPDLIKKIETEIKTLKTAAISKENEKELKNNLDRFVKQISLLDSVEAKNFRSLISIFGSSRCIDLLYKFHPEFKGVPVEQAKSILADYLGDFLVAEQEFQPSNLPQAGEHLSDATFREGLFETIKDHCLRYYFATRRSDVKKDGYQIIHGYLDHILEETGHIKSAELDSIIQDVILYYESALRDFHKPEQFVDNLSSERDFPDINQRINMKELADKKRLLIADEMGLGKSASVIMAKEQLGVKCALVTAPSNVLDTWEMYLSDKKDNTGKQQGYFKSGRAPRVLRVVDQHALDDINAKNYDYILISQERLNKRHVATLKDLDFDMLIVDEVHKLKKMKGARSPHLVELSRKIEGENKYLALLSGTPAPDKVQDLAIILKLLHPKQFEKTPNKVLVKQIINGDIVDLRNLLIPRMQMKDLEDSVEMPQLTETVDHFELSQLENDVYEALVEQDELTATEKIRLLRQFLLNPDMLEATPGVESAKLQQLNKRLAISFAKHDKVVMFVNDYIDDIFRGDIDILKKIQVPTGTQIRVIHGENKPEREKILQEFKIPGQKMLLIVSGKTADVGINLSNGEDVIFYNEPWTEAQRRQELARVYRPGLEKDLTSTTLIAAGTIEDGIHNYIQHKYAVVEKILRGIPITEAERNLAQKDEQSEGLDQSVNQEHAEYYLSSWELMMRMFGHVKEIGERGLHDFLAKHGGDYAKCYIALGNRSYQANANRVTATLLHELLKARGKKESAKILDLASGPEMLKRHIADEHKEKVVSIDINTEHFKGTKGENRLAGSMTSLPFKNGSFDYVNLTFALHYTKFVPSKDNFERMQVLAEMNRVLKPGGRVLINNVHSFEFKNQEKFKEVAAKLGFAVVEELSGETIEDVSYRSQMITLEKIEELDANFSAEQLTGTLNKEQINGLKFKETKSKIKDSRKIITSFKLGGREYTINFNKADQAVYEEEQAILKVGQSLKEQYGSVVDIPAEVVIQNGFVRLSVSKKKNKKTYILFKTLSSGSGAIYIK